MENASHLTANKRITLVVFFILILSMSSAHANVKSLLTDNTINVQKSTEHIHTGKIPDGVSEFEWNNIQSQIQANQYKAYGDQDSGFKSSNPANGWHIDYSTDGTTTLSPYKKSTDHDYHISLRLNAIFYQNNNSNTDNKADKRMFDQPLSLNYENNRLNFHWNDHIIEYWINSRQKLEQWFEITHRPQWPKDDQGLLEIRMDLDTDLDVNLKNNRLSLGHITYDGLKVWDANDRVLPSQLVLNNGYLSIQVDDHNAKYPITVDPSFAQEAYIKASNTEAADSFGHSVSISGDTMVVGATGEDSSATGINGTQSDNSASNSGAAYVFVKSGGTWSQQAYLKASNTEADDLFGWSVAISGDTIVVGARLESSNATGVNGVQSDNSALFSGAAYVFVRSGSTWTQQAYLKASNTGSNDRFGSSVAISDDSIVIGAELEASNATGINGDEADNSDSNSGAAYVFVRSGSTWTQQAYIKASNTDADDRFGQSVSISDNTLVVGAFGEDSNATGIDGTESDNSASDSGAAYVFIRSGSTWTQQAYLKASNTEANDIFGYSVSISGDTIVVGATGEDSNAIGINGDQTNNLIAGSGAAYVFVRDTGLWTQQAYIKASNRTSAFGESVSISGNTLAVGVNSNLGSGYVFSRTGTSWIQQSSLAASNAEDGDQFGTTVSVSGDTVVIGALGEDSNAMGINGTQSDNSASSAGATYVYEVAYFIGGSVSGLATGNSLTLQNNGANDQVISTNGAFAFSDALFDGSNYDVTVLNNPTSPNQTCTVLNGNGTVTGLDISNIMINCVTETYTVGGSASGLAVGNSVILQNNGGDAITVSDNGVFTFTNAIDDNSIYAVTVLTQPTTPNQTCSITNGNGIINGSDISNITVNCVTETYTIGGSVTGLATDNSVLLQNNGGDNLVVSSNGAFTFSTALDDNSSYAITVLTQPTSPNQTCSITNDSGMLSGNDVTNVTINCVTETYTIGGSVTGLAPDNIVTLQNSGGDDLIISSDGIFTFNTALNDESSYEVSVLTQPASPNQTCSVTNGNGTLAGNNVTNVLINCVTETYTVGGTVTGLATNNSVLLQNNGGNNLIVSSNGSFTFTSALDDESNYLVTVISQPTSPNQTCSIVNGNGTLAGADITNVMVNCVTETYTIGGSVSGLALGNDLTLQNNGGDDLIISNDGTFTFSTALDDESNYAVTVLTQPTSPNQTCSVTNGNSILAGNNVTNVVVNCVTETYTVGGTVTGLATNNSVLLQNNGGNNLIVSNNGVFTFTTALDDESNYLVTVISQPTSPNQTCSIVNGNGTLSGTDITNVMVNCVTETYTIGGSVTGLAPDNSLTIQNNGGDDLIISGDGTFIFSTALDDESSYEVTVLNQPTSPNQTCSVTNSNSTLAGNNVTNISINCVTETYTIGGSVTGLATNNNVFIQNNGTNTLIVSSNGAFVFSAPVNDGSNYSVTVLTQPSSPDQICSVLNGSGNLAGTDVTDVLISCNNVPIVVADFYVTNEDTTLLALDTDGSTADTNDNSVLLNDSDGLSIVSPGQFTVNGIGGSIAISANGTFNYTPPDDAFGTATFDYQVTDGILTADAQLNINVLSVNDAPEFTISGDIVVDVLEFDTNPVVFDDFIVDFNTGPDNESTQQISQYNVVIQSDTDGIINDASVSNAGVLSIDFTTNIGMALIDITLQDDGGTSLNGEDTSASQSFFIAFANDIIYINGFESTSELLFMQHIHELQAKTMHSNYPVYENDSAIIEFYGELFHINNDNHNPLQLETLKYWLNEVLMYKAPYDDYDGDGIINALDKQPFN